MSAVRKAVSFCVAVGRVGNCVQLDKQRLGFRDAPNPAIQISELQSNSITINQHPHILVLPAILILYTILHISSPKWKLSFKFPIKFLQCHLGRPRRRWEGNIKMDLHDHVVSPCHHGMARPQVMDGRTAYDMGGSC